MAQIKQESGGDPYVCSAYACGLTQFTPATAKWMEQKYGVELGGGGVFNPVWAIRALVLYDKFLFDRVKGLTECDRWKFTLSAYNGGEGWRVRDQRLAAKYGKNPMSYDQVAPFNAGRAAVFFRENRDYPMKIIYKHQPLYRHWGRAVCV